MNDQKHTGVNQPSNFLLFNTFLKIKFKDIGRHISSSNIFKIFQLL